MKLGLALSGGGFRATLFHLGVIRYLCDSGHLGEVRHITAVSGGSVLAAHLALNWSRYLDPMQFDDAAKKVIDFARLDLRGRIQRRLATHLYVTYLRPESLLRWPPRLRRFGTIRGTLFERFLARHLYGQSTLGSIHKKEPQAPGVDILATNLSLGSLAYFSANRFVPNDLGTKAFERDFSLARAVAISAAFPGFFPTTEINSEVLFADQEDFPNSEYLADGGIYDNLGLRRFRTILKLQPGAFDRILVCNASGYFDWLVGRETLGMLKTAWRSSEIFMKRLADLECEIAGLGQPAEASGPFVHLPIDELVEAQGSTELLPEVAQEQLKNIRTDLDLFEGDAIDALQWHGYSVAAKRVGPLFERSPGTGWRPKSSRPDKPAEVLAKRLRQARLRRLRLFSWRDWISYLHVAALVIALAVTGVPLWNRFQQARFLSDMNDLKRDSFGQVKEIASPEALLEQVATAVNRWPKNPRVQIEAALLSYSVMTKFPHGDLKERSADILKQTIDAIQEIRKSQPLPSHLEASFLQLKGHRYLEEGELLWARNRESATASYHEALRSYEEQRRVTFRGLYGLEFNVCNTAIMVGELENARTHCEYSHRYALEEGIDFWQAKFNLGEIHLRKDQPAQAAAEFVKALEIAIKKGEDNQLRGYLGEKKKALPALCADSSFKRAFGAQCAAPIDP